jgi:hypothetical protein
MEVYGRSHLLHIQQGKYSICVEDENEKLHNNTLLQS